jgi:hypothetical protein
MTTVPEKDDDAERAEFWRLTQEALAKHPDALDEDLAWERSLRDGLEHD